MKQSRVAAVSAGVGAMLLLGGYLAADAADRVPGILTTVPQPSYVAPPTPEPLDLPLISGMGSAPEDAAAAPLPDSAKLRTALGNLEEKITALDGELSVMVLDQLSGEVLLEEQAQRELIPASTTKVFTAAAALLALDPAATLTTETAYADGKLYLRSAGDVMLGADAGGEDAFGYAGLADLAKQTAKTLAPLTKSVTLVVDDSPVSGPERNPQWTAQEVNDYAGNVTDLAVYEGRRNPARAVNFTPRPALEAAQLFQKHLRANGIEVTGQITFAPLPPAATETGKIQSAPLFARLRWSLKSSDNTYFENLCRRLSQQRGGELTFEGAAKQVMEVLKENKLLDSGVNLKDCSGLDNRNRISAAAFVKLQQGLSQNPRTNLIPQFLPVAGWDGTLDERMLLSRAAGRVQAKTGSLHGVTALSGFIRSPAGRNLNFAVLANYKKPGSGYVARAALDAFLKEVANS